jgi:hypothetical protein
MRLGGSKLKPCAQGDQMRKLLYAAAMLAAALLAGCPAKKDATGDTAGMVRKSAVTPEPQASGGDAAAVEASKAGEEPTSQPPVASEHNSIPEDGELVGKWFSLFANQLGGPHLYTAVEGHTLDFTENGKVVWAMTGVGKHGPTMVTTYRVEGQELVLSYQPNGLSTGDGLASSTPLGYGRDKEVGLDSAGRDKEIGLSDNKSPAIREGDGNRELRLGISSDGRYLGLADQFGQITVYGRMKNPGKEFTKNLAGDWSGHSAPNEPFRALFKINGDEVTASIDGGRKKFEGHIVNGYIAGELTEGDKTVLAALLPESEGTINGAWTGDPDWNLNLEFDFVR